MKKYLILLYVTFSLFIVFTSHLKAQTTDIPRGAYGWLKIHTNLEHFYAVIDDDLENSHLLVSGDSIYVPSGNHELRIVWRNVSDYTSTVYIESGNTTIKRVSFFTFTSTPKSSYTIINDNANLRIYTDVDSEIRINGDRVGMNNAELLLNSGKYKLEIVHPEYGILTKKINVGYYEVTTINRFNQNFNPTPSYLKLLPGVGYLSNKQTKKATLTYTSLALLSGIGIYFNSKYNSKNDLFRQQNEAYLAATSTQDAIVKRKVAQSTLSDMKNLNTRITIATISALTLYAITTFDGFRKPRDGYRGPKFYQPQFGLSRNSLDGNLFAQIKLIKKF